MPNWMIRTVGFLFAVAAIVIGVVGLVSPDHGDLLYMAPPLVALSVVCSVILYRRSRMQAGVR